MSSKLRRRTLLVTAAALPWAARAADDDAIAARLAEGGGVIALRHALAPGTFDPPGFRLGDCSTQRNLNAQGQAQARRIGAWFRSRGLHPATVRSSPWCRCLDTGRLAFGHADHWSALGSPRHGDDATNAAALNELRDALAEASRMRGKFQAWITHQFVLSALTGSGSTSGEGLLLDTAPDGQARLLGRLAIG